jgi:hypothetical protein
MSKLIISIALASSLTGCFVELDAPSISLQRPCDRSEACTFRGIPDETQSRVPLELANGSREVPIDLGSDGILEEQYGIGPITLDANLGLEELIVTTLDGVALDGIDSLEIVREDGTTIAGFSPEMGGMAKGGEVRLAGNPDINLFDLGMSFTLRFDGAGRLPREDWMANIELRVRLNAVVE